MQKNYRCPRCRATMEFDPELGKMHCKYCGGIYSVPKSEESAEAESEKPQVEEPKAEAKAELEAKAKMKPISKREKEEKKKEARQQAKMKMQILHCNSCGAELAVNEVEASSFCAYCGQATVVLDRVDECLRPDYVMPFMVTKEEAEKTIRSKISAGFYVPDEIKNFEIEKLRGIYVPFWLYDILYGDEQFWRYSVKRGKSTVIRYSHRVADCHYRKLTVDASRNLNDDSSQRLEPYDMDKLKKFEPMYLSGFYADRFDMGLEETRDVAVSRAKAMLNESIKGTIRRSARNVYSSPVYEVMGAEYALLPAWFLTFRQGDQPYTILMNGQTKKIVGAVPCVKWKVWLTFAILAIVLCGFLVPTCGGIIHSLVQTTRYNSGIWELYLYIFIFGGALLVWVWRSAIKKYLAFKESVKLTRSGTTSRFVGERQDK